MRNLHVLRYFSLLFGIFAQALAQEAPADEKDFLADVEEALFEGRDNFSNLMQWQLPQDRPLRRQLRNLKEACRPMFMALPKKSNGRLRHGVVSYALHRLFVQRHGWLIPTLHPASKAWAAWRDSSPTAMIEDRVPSRVLQLLEQRVGRATDLRAEGFGLQELVVLAAILEQLVYDEAIQRLVLAYHLLEFQCEQNLREADAADIIDMYMANYILGGDIFAMPPIEMIERRKVAIDQYPTWPETQHWLHQLRKDIAPNLAYFGFKDMAAVIEVIGERYGRWQDHECRSLRQALVEIEGSGASNEITGRVHIADFYRGALNDGQWQFSESTHYLRELGALDESVQGVPHLIIANYINSPANCVASSRYYAVCCLDECEFLLQHLESNLAAPHGKSEAIVSLVQSWRARSDVNSKLHVHLLEKIASHHGGTVPLHGRLFAQWLHYVFPRECSYPHVSGTINPMQSEEYLESSGRHYSATIEEMQQHIDAMPAKRHPNKPEGARQEANSASQDCPMWTMEEELADPEMSIEDHWHPLKAAAIVSKLVSAVGALHQTSFSVSGLRGVALLTALLSAALLLFKITVPYFEGAPDMQPRKFAV